MEVRRLLDELKQALAEPQKLRGCSGSVWTLLGHQRHFLTATEDLWRTRVVLPRFRPGGRAAVVRPPSTMLRVDEARYRKAPEKKVSLVGMDSR